MTTSTTTTPIQEQQRNELNTPWTLQFDRDGTEDFGIICDSQGNDLVASHLPQLMPPRWANRGFGEGCFWLPEQQGDPIPVLARQMQLMIAAPKLLEALVQIVAILPSGTQPWEANSQERLARETALQAIAEVTSDSIGRGV